METIQKPQALKRIFVWLVNLILFFFYYYALSFIAGLIAGVVIMLSGNDFDAVSEKYEWFTTILVLIAFIVNIVLVFVARKKIYFHVVDKTVVQATVQTPVQTPVQTSAVEGPANQ